MSTAVPPRPLAITGATLIDGSGGAPIDHATVVIEGERFTHAGPAAAVPAPHGAEVIDARGKFLIPGLVDMHVHAGPPPREHLALFLDAGVTTVLDLGGQVSDLTVYRSAIQTGTKAGPRLYFTGPMLEEGKPFEGFAAMSRQFEPDDVEAEVDGLAGQGVDAIKLYITVRPQTARRAVTRAHAHGLRVFMHQQATWGADAADAGVDCLEHLMVFGDLAPKEGRPFAATMTPFEYGGWMWRWLPDVDTRSAQVQRTFERMLRAGTALDPTLVLFAARPAALGAGADVVGDTTMDDPESTPLLSRLPEPVAAELVSRWSERLRAGAGASTAARERAMRAWEKLLELVGAFHAAGGMVLAGTDCPNVAIVSGYSLHRELELLVHAGLSPMQALLAATSRPAARLDMGGTFGRIHPGLSADLLVLGENPLLDIHNTRSVETVIVRGRVHTPAAPNLRPLP